MRNHLDTVEQGKIHDHLQGLLGGSRPDLGLAVVVYDQLYGFVFVLSFLAS